MPRPAEHLYVHVPFCAAKCEYCAFYSLPIGDAPKTIDSYLDRLAGELIENRARFEPLRSRFIGGGTPSLLPAQALTRLLTILNSLAQRSDAESTVECNPASLDAERIDILSAGGVNRVSLGIQSWDEGLRRRLGRRIPAGDPGELVDRCRAAGIARIGCDLIYAIPGQSLQQWSEDLKRSADLGVESLSTYSLTVEEGTRLASRLQAPVDDDLSVDMWEAAGEILAPYGLRRYEVSNFARPGYECRHNQAIWHGESYLGCGPAACSFDGVTRFSNPADLEAWLKGTPPSQDPLPARHRAAEILAFGLRTVQGWSSEEFRDITGFDPWELCGAQLDILLSQSLVISDDCGIRPTRRGLLFADTIGEILLV